jgi:hypothetical protein
MQNSYKGWNKILLSKIKEVYLENALNATVFVAWADTVTLGFL